MTLRVDSGIHFIHLINLIGVSMKQALDIAIAFVAFIVAMVAFTLGIDYLDPEIAHGLNPWIAFPITICCILYIFFLLRDDDKDTNS